ncbi:MAG: hypothetical protein IT235_08840 [Bacteroidia bacterium]|nr:hypothetical protein [Bacteroidia bacterium]
MKIAINKKTLYQCEYAITRNDKTVELIILETKTYLIHDICHYSVEKNLNCLNGFWGMLSQGHTFNELFGKNNPQTESLRFIEKIVGPIQSVYLGYIPKNNLTQHIEHLHYEITEDSLTTCLTEIKNIMDTWKRLTVGQQLTLEWKV